MDDRRVAVITGAGSGIGRAAAGRLARDGYLVVAADLDEPGAKETAAGIGEAAIAAVVDVADPSSVAGLIQRALELGGRIDALVSSAGIAGPSLPAWEIDDATWREVVDVNLSGVFFSCRAVLPHMVERGWGRIVNVASIAGKEGNPNAVPYSASKSGVIGLTKALAKEVATTGVLVNCVTPAVIDTPILEQVTQDHLRYMLSRIPMGRAGTVDEVAALISWLCSEECSFSTGAVFDISGGRATY